MKSANIELTAPCYARTPIEGVNALKELAQCGKLNLRGDSSSSDFAAAIATVCGIELPTTVNAVRENAPNTLFCLGPDEWLLHCELDNCLSIADALTQQLGDAHSAVTDVSDYYTVLHLQGPNASEILRRGCPLDLHPSVFQPGAAAQTRFGHASILLNKLSDGESWNIQVRWSYAEYVWDYLASAMGSI